MPSLTSQVAKLREVVMDLCGQTQDPIEKQEVICPIELDQTNYSYKSMNDL